MQSREQVFLYVLIFFALTTGITGMLNMAASGALTLSNVNSLVVGNAQVPGQLSLNIAGSSGQSNSSLIYSDDFTNATGFNQSSIFPTGPNGGLLALYNPWTQETPLGYVLTGSILYQPGEFQVVGIQPSNGVYDVVYNINNTANSEFAIEPLCTAGQNFVQILFTSTDVEVDESNADNPPTLYQTLFQTSYYYPTTVTQVETIYNPTANTLVINIQSGTLSTFTVNLASLNSLGFYNTPKSYGGVQAWSNGFTIKQVNAPINTAIAVQAVGGGTITNIPILDSIIAAGAAVINAVSNFGVLIGQVFGVGQTAAVPFWLWAIFGLPCLAFMIVFGIEIARGI